MNLFVIFNFFSKIVFWLLNAIQFSYQFQYYEMHFPFITIIIKKNNYIVLEIMKNIIKFKTYMNLESKS